MMHKLCISIGGNAVVLSTVAAFLHTPPRRSTARLERQQRLRALQNRGNFKVSINSSGWGETCGCEMCISEFGRRRIRLCAAACGSRNVLAQLRRPGARVVCLRCLL